jgi:hypothetical protein
MRLYFFFPCLVADVVVHFGKDLCWLPTQLESGNGLALSAEIMSSKNAVSRRNDFISVVFIFLK